MLERLRASSLRTRLIAALVLTTGIALAASFYALHERTGADLNDRVDEQLGQDLAEFRSSTSADVTDAATLRAAARRFVNSQGYHADSRIFAIELADGTVVTNEPQLLGESGPGGAASEAEHEDGDDEFSDDDSDPDEDSDAHLAAALLAGSPGLSTVASGDEGRLRVLSEPIEHDGTELGTFHVADSLGQVSEAQEGLRDTLLVVALVALAIVVLAAAVIAARLAAPLKRIERFAADVDAGDVDQRIATDDGPAEIRSLSESFNHMLDRLQGSLTRQREFVADASHELRTPLTVARGEIDLMTREAEGDERLHLETVGRELRRMDRLVNDMLILAGADDGVPLELEQIDLDDFLEDLERDLPLLGERNYSVAGASGVVCADRERLTQVLRNLVRNSVAHTGPDGRIEIAVRAAAGSVRFEVDDDGVGFSPEQAARLFDRFYRTDEGRGRDSGGSGLGLAIAKAIVEAHGGRIWAGSSPAGGARVGFELPNAKDGPKARPSPG